MGDSNSNFGGSGIFGSLISGLFGLGATALTNRSNRKAQEAQNRFNAMEALKDREFQSAEAEIARDWQEKFYNQYQSPEAMVRQYEAAGLNPAMMYGGSGPSSGSVPPTSVPSGAQATASQTYFMDAMNIIDSVMRLDLLKSEISLNKDRGDESKASAEEHRSKVDSNIAEAEYKRSLVSVSNAQVEKIGAEIGHIAEMAETEDMKQDILEIQKEIENYSKQSAEWQKDFRDKHGLNGGEPLWEMIYKISVHQGKNVWEFLKDNLSALSFLDQKSIPLTSSGNPYGR